MKKFLKTLGKITAVLASITAALGAISMIVYYFNLDMKLTAALEPILAKWYDHVDRNKRL